MGVRVQPLATACGSQGLDTRQRCQSRPLQMRPASCIVQAPSFAAERLHTFKSPTAVLRTLGATSKSQHSCASGCLMCNRARAVTAQHSDLGLRAQGSTVQADTCSARTHELPWPGQAQPAGACHQVPWWPGGRRQGPLRTTCGTVRPPGLHGRIVPRPEWQQRPSGRCPDTQPMLPQPHAQC